MVVVCGLLCVQRVRTPNFLGTALLRTNETLIQPGDSIFGPHLRTETLSIISVIMTLNLRKKRLLISTRRTFKRSACAYLRTAKIASGLLPIGEITRRSGQTSRDSRLTPC